MKTKPCAGLLPLYLRLYDETSPELRAGFEPFQEAVRDGLAARGLEVRSADVCRVAGEVEAAVSSFERVGVDCIVTLHLAYSPSLEAAPALCRTALPLLLLDTTMDASFGTATAADRIMYNHGVHGVMDLASILRRNGRRFEIAAGHVAQSDVLDRAADIVRAARAARAFRATRALRIGPSFEGMGDFAVPAEVMKARLGIDVESLAVDALAGEMTAVTEAEIGREMAEDRERFEIRVERDLHERSVRSGLALRRVLDRGGYAAFSVNFQAFARGDGPVMPFLEISKAMSRGIGFGGEGDVLTAALVGALAQGFGQTTFTEIFCSDWAGDSLFLSHMGEINPDLAGARPRVVKKDYAFLGAPAAAVVCGIRAGPAAFANLVPGPDEGFDLLVAPVEMLEDTSGGNLDGTVRGWMRPALPVARFLEVYSRHGGTHHSALAMGRRAEAVAAFAGFAGLGCTRIGG